MLFIPKKLWLIEEQRFLKYHEIINSEVGYILESQKYRELGIGYGKHQQEIFRFTKKHISGSKEF